MSTAVMLCCLIMLIAIWIMAPWERLVSGNATSVPNPALASLYGVYTTTDNSTFDLLPPK